jgi:hypothetical protein
MRPSAQAGLHSNTFILLFSASTTWNFLTQFSPPAPDKPLAK